VNDHPNARDVLQIPRLARRATLRRALVLGGLIVIAGLAVAYSARPKAGAVLYRFERAERRTIVQLVETSGNLDVRSRVEVPAPVAGLLTEVAVAPLQHVEKGQLLAKLDQRAGLLGVRSAEVSVEAAAGRLAQATTALESARQTAARVQRLRDKGLASQQDFIEADAARQQAQAALVAARSEKKLAAQSVAAAHLQQSLTRIEAPEAGVVLRAPEAAGAAVAPEREPLFVIAAPLDVMRVEALVSETEISSVTLGKKAEVLVQALPGRSFEATVERIGIEPKREGGVVRYPVKLLVKNEDGALLPGMSARVRMEVNRVADALSVHEAAVRFSPPDADPSSTPRVWRKGDSPNQLEPIAVDTGISDGVYVAIRPVGGALAAGDEVAIGLLQPGQSSSKPKVSLGKK
jgi:HlyD family secretion protein